MPRLTAAVSEGPPFFTAALSLWGTAKATRISFSRGRCTLPPWLPTANGNQAAAAARWRVASYNGGNRWTYGAHLYKAAKEFGLQFRLAWHWTRSGRSLLRARLPRGRLCLGERSSGRPTRAVSGIRPHQRRPRRLPLAHYTSAVAQAKSVTPAGNRPSADATRMAHFIWTTAIQTAFRVDDWAHFRRQW